MQGDDWQHPDSKDNRTFRYILNSGADIICLQEYCGSLKNIPAMSDELADSISLIYPYAASYKENELGIISKYPVSRVAAPVLNGETVDDHSFAIFKVQIGRETLYVVNVHLASYMLNNTERNVVTNIHSVGTAKRSLGEFKGSIMQKMKASFRFRADESGIVRGVIDSLPGNVIVCGDFNDVPLSWAYRTIRGSDVKDAYVETGFGPIVTYNKHRFLFHIDQILYRGELRPLSVERGSLKSSDHYPVKATFAY
jgi:endonuclease/exonuclease/phosphatase (EEP) superfamily protein YafD